MNVTLKELVQAEPALSMLLTYKFIGAAGYNLRKLSKLVTQELQNYYTEHKTLLDKYGETKNDKDYTFPVPGQYQAFKTDFENLQNVSVEIAVTGIDPEAIMEEKVPLSAIEWAVLEPFFKAI